MILSIWGFSIHGGTPIAGWFIFMVPHFKTPPCVNGSVIATRLDHHAYIDHLWMLDFRLLGDIAKGQLEKNGKANQPENQPAKNAARLKYDVSLRNWQLFFLRFHVGFWGLLPCRRHVGRRWQKKNRNEAQVKPAMTSHQFWSFELQSIITAPNWKD